MITSPPTEPMRVILTRLVTGKPHIAKQGGYWRVFNDGPSWQSTNFWLVGQNWWRFR